MQNCPITHITLLKTRSRYPTLYGLGELFFLLQVCTREDTFYQTTRRRHWRGSAYQTLGRLGGFFTTRLYERGHFLPDYAAAEALTQGCEAFRILCAGERKWRGASARTHSLTTRLYEGRGKTKQTPLMPGCRRFLLHTLYKLRDPLIA